MSDADETRELLIDQLYGQLDEAHQTIVTLTEQNEALRAELAEREASGREER